MKGCLKAFLAGLIVLGVGAVLVLGYLGYIPGLSDLMGANRPRDLGITYTEADRSAARAKSQLEYEALPANTAPAQSLQRSGTRSVTTAWSSAEMTALMNDRPWKYWPIRNVQLRINNDGTAELSGVVMRDKLSGYGQAIGVPQAVIDGVVKLLPPNPAFYVKAKTSLTNNTVSDFDIQSVSLGHVSIPVDTLLAHHTIGSPARAQAADIATELNKYSGKKAAIVGFINQRLSQIPGFFAKRAYFSDGKLNFDGSLSAKESTVR